MPDTGVQVVMKVLAQMLALDGNDGVMSNKGTQMNARIYNDMYKRRRSALACPT